MAGLIGALRVDLSANTATFTAGLKKAQNQSVSFGRAVNDNIAPTGRFSSQLQNVGYQVQDVAVQITGGTSALRAFGQQLPQLLSGFGVFGTVLGTLAAVGLGIAAAMSGSEKGAKTTDEAIDNLSKTMAAAKDVTDLLALSQADLATKFGSAAAGAAVAAARARDSITGLREGIEAIGTPAFQPFVDVLDRARTIAGTLRQEFVAGRDDVAALVSAFDLAPPVAQQLVAGMQQFKEATTGPAMAGALLNLYQRLSDAKEEMGQLPPEAEALRAALGGAVDTLTAATAQTKELAGALSGAAVEAEKLARMRALALEQKSEQRQNLKDMQATEDSRMSQDRGTFLSYQDRINLGTKDTRSPKYAPTKSRSGGASGEKTWDRATAAIERETAILKARTEAQAKLNPLVDDYGAAEAKARVEAQLLSQAESAKIPITDTLKTKIGELAQAYADVTVTAGQVDEAHQRVLDRMQEVDRTGADVTSGLVQGLLDGASASEVLANSLARVGDALLQSGINAIFQPQQGGGGSLFSQVLSSFGIPGFANGVRNFRGGLARVNERGGELINLPRGARVIPHDLSERMMGGGTVLHYSPTINAPNADAAGLARVEALLQQQAETFRGNVQRAVRDRRNLGRI